MPLTAVRHIRKMRGGAQSHLLQADDGNWYVVKFRNNPQHRRILINELIASALLEYLHITAPETALVRITQDFLREHTDVHLTLGARRVEVETGWHFGSRYPGDPERTAIYDFLPDALLPQVANLFEFRAVLVFDQWTGNADGRQSVFYRANVAQPGYPGKRSGFVACMIDHGFVFNGPHWDFVDSPLQGLYARRLVYDDVRSIDDFQPWLDLVVHFPEEVIDRALKRVPVEWMEGEEEELEKVLEALMRRRARLPELLQGCRDVRATPFTNWSCRP
jgi:hypothetical protein